LPNSAGPKKELAKMKRGLGITIGFAAILVLMSPFAHADDKNEALLQAVKKGDTDRVKALVVQGADPNAKDKLGSPALLGAACAGHTEIVKALLAAGADVDAKGALVAATALICAASEGHTESVKALLAAGADVNAKNRYGHTALYLAAQGCHTESLKALLEAEADANAESEKVILGLRAARLMGCTRAVELLKQAAAAGVMEKPDRTPAVAPRTLNGQKEDVPVQRPDEFKEGAAGREMKGRGEDGPETVAGTGSESSSPQDIPPGQKMLPGGTFTVNVASFREEHSADRYVEKLKKKGMDAFSWVVNLPKKGRWYRVSVGSFPTRQEAQNYMKAVRQEGISDAFIIKIPEPS
jgi:ankyrin repeat protein